MLACLLALLAYYSSLDRFLYLRRSAEPKRRPQPTKRPSEAHRLQLLLSYGAFANHPNVGGGALVSPFTSPLDDANRPRARWRAGPPRGVHGAAHPHGAGAVRKRRTSAVMACTRDCGGGRRSLATRTAVAQARAAAAGVQRRRRHSPPRDCLLFASSAFVLLFEESVLLPHQTSAVAPTADGHSRGERPARREQQIGPLRAKATPTPNGARH